MADQPIDVRVLSPIPEAEGGINFPSLSPSITIRELKLKIRDALPSHPAPERMRIIYFGRVVGNDMTLGNVFHGETLQSSGRRGNLHMVLSEAPRSYTAPPNVAHPLPRPSSERAPATHASQRPQSQPPHADRLPTHDTNGQAQRNLQAAQAQILHQQQAFFQQLGMGVNHPGGPAPLYPSPGPIAPNQIPENMRTTAVAINPFLPPQPNVPLRYTPSQGLPGPTNNTGHEAPAPNGEHAGDLGNRVRYAVEASFATIPTHAAGLPPIPTGLPPGIPTGGPVQRSVVFAIPPNNHLHTNPVPGTRPPSWVIRDLQQTPVDTLLQQVQDSMNDCQQAVSYLNNEVFTGAPRDHIARLTPSTTQQVARQLERVNAHLYYMNEAILAMVATPEGSRNREILSLQMENERMHLITHRLIRAISRLITARRRESNQQAAAQHPSVQPPADNQIPAQTSGAPAPASQSRAGPFLGAQSSARQNVYQVVGPDGTRSLLFPPQPNVANVSSENWNENLAYQRALRDLVQIFAQNQSPAIDTAAIVQQNPAAAALAQVPQAEGPLGNIDAVRALFPQPAQPAEPAQPAQAPVQNQAQAQDPAAGPGNVAAVPIGAIAAHFWLLLRIFGMLWLFSGSGWRRTLLMALCGLIVYVIQSGIFGAVLGERIEGIRRHFEALVGVPPPRAGAQAANDQNENDGQQEADAADGTRRRRRDPSPEEVAQRILRERQAQRNTWFRVTIQSIERQLALFVASLWPGLGERMVAAREEAEAQARRDAQDREERRQREQQEQQQQQQQQQAQVDSTQSSIDAENQARQSAQQTVDVPPVVEGGDESTPVDRAVEGDQAAKVDKGKGRAVETDSTEGTVATGSSEPSSAAGATTTRRQPWSNNAEE